MTDTAAPREGHENCGCHFDDGCPNWPNCGHVPGYAKWVRDARAPMRRRHG